MSVGWKGSKRQLLAEGGARMRETVGPWLKTSQNKRGMMLNSGSGGETDRKESSQGQGRAHPCSFLSMVRGHWGKTAST